MPRKHKNEGLAKLLVILGGLIALIEAILWFTGAPLVKVGVGGIAGAIIALLLAIVALLSALKPNDPIPWNKLFLVVLGILIIVFGTLIGGILVLLAGILLFL